MSEQRHFQMGGGGNNAGQGQQQLGDTTYTKIFVGGLAWETQRETMKRYFEQFGEIQEAVVITDKYTGRSKGYGFVTFKDPDSAVRACQDPSPVIDGRRANCNLASLGANRSQPSTSQPGVGRIRPIHGSVPPMYRGASSTYFQQPSQYPFSYGYSGYSPENMYTMSYYSMYGGHQFPPYYTATAGQGMFQNFYPYYPQYGQGSIQAQGFGLQYPQMVQHPYLPQQYGAGILSLPTSTASTAGVAASTRSGPSQSGPVTGTEQTSST